MLDAGCWILDVGYSMSNLILRSFRYQGERVKFARRRSVLDFIQHLASSIQHHD
jgi:hypothetical protein